MAKLEPVARPNPRGSKPGHTNNPNGRPVGSLTRLSRKRAAELVESGESPIEIMLGNMTFWHRHAEAMTEKVGLSLDELREMMAVPGVMDNPEMVSNLKELNKRIIAFMDEMLEARQRSQECAVDAAPYCHPRLHAIHAKPPEPKDITPDAIPLDPIEASRIYLDVMRD